MPPAALTHSIEEEPTDGADVLVTLHLVEGLDRRTGHPGRLELGTPHCRLPDRERGGQLLAEGRTVLDHR